MLSNVYVDRQLSGVEGLSVSNFPIPVAVSSQQPVWQVIFADA